MEQKDFKYGQCTTDWKDGHNRLKQQHGNLFWDSKPENDFVLSTLEKLQLPLPSRMDSFNGIHHKILFLDSHGMVIRIGLNGTTDPRLFLHPHILQPVGWTSDKELGISIVLYKAAHLFEPPPNPAPKAWMFWKKDKRLTAIRQIEKSLQRSKFRRGDIYTLNNIGFLQVDKKTRFPVCIDISVLIAEEHHEYPPEQKTFEAFKKERENSPAFDALKVSFIHHTHSPFAAFSARTCRQVFNYHQPLRHAFFSAWPNADKNEGDPDPVKMQRFWQMARNYVENGYKICQKDPQTGKRLIVAERRSPIPWK